MTLLYSAQNLLETEIVKACFATVIGRVEVADGVITLTYCHEHMIGGLLTAVPGVLVHLPVAAICRNGAILREAFRREGNPVLVAAADMLLAGQLH